MDILRKATISINLENYYNKNDCNSIFAYVTGDTMTGPLLLKKTDIDNVLQIQNDAGNVTSYITGEGKNVVKTLNISGITSNTGLTNYLVVDANREVYYQTGSTGGSGTSGSSGSSGTDGTSGSSGIDGTSGSSGSSGSVGSAPYVEKNSNYTLTDNDYTVNCTGGTFTITPQTAVGIVGRIYNIKNTGTGTIIVDGDGIETIDGELTQTVGQWENLQVQSTGIGWIIL